MRLDGNDMKSPLQVEFRVLADMGANIEDGLTIRQATPLRDLGFDGQLQIPKHELASLSVGAQGIA
jgi:hypothetical protein